MLPAALLLLSPGATCSFRLLLCSGGALGAGQDSAARDLLSKGKQLPSLQSSDLSPTVWVSLGTKSSSKEWMGGRCCWCSLPALSASSPPEGTGRGRKDQPHLCMQHKSTQGSSAHAQGCSCVPQQCVHALGELWSVLCPRAGSSCSWLSPAWPSEPLCAATAPWAPLLNQQQPGLQEGRAAGFSKENPQTRQPCGNKHQALHFP